MYNNFSRYGVTSQKISRIKGTFDPFSMYIILYEEKHLPRIISKNLGNFCKFVLSAYRSLHLSLNLFQMLITETKGNWLILQESGKWLNNQFFIRVKGGSIWQFGNL